MVTYFIGKHAQLYLIVSIDMDFVEVYVTITIKKKHSRSDRKFMTRTKIIN